MHETFFVKKHLFIFLPILILFIGSCDKLEITPEKTPDNVSETPIISSNPTAFTQLTAPSQNELPPSSTPYVSVPTSTHIYEAPYSPTRTPKNYKPITIDFIHMFDETNGWAIANEKRGDYAYRTVLHSQDSGYTWVGMPGGEDAYLVPPWATSFLDASTGWTAEYYEFEEDPQSNKVYFLRWFNHSVCETKHNPSGSISSPGLGIDSVLFLDFVDCDHGWFMFNTFAGAGHHVHELYSSYDGGASWESLIPFTESLCSKTGMDFIDEKYGWITTSCPFDPGSALLERTEDGGVSWLSIYLPPPASSPDTFKDALYCETSFPTLFSAKSGSLMVRCYFQESTEAFLITTNDSGETWSTKPFPGEVPLFITQEVGWALGKDIYRTLDGGQTWSLMSTVDWEGQFSFVNDQIGWAVTRLGEKTELVYTNDGGRTWLIIEPIWAGP
jgi:hypothetical protein